MRRNNRKVCSGVAYDWDLIAMISQTQNKLWKIMLSSEGHSYLWARDHFDGQQTLQKLLFFLSIYFYLTLVYNTY